MFQSETVKCINSESVYSDWGFPYRKSFEVEDVVLLIELNHDFGMLWNVMPCYMQRTSEDLENAKSCSLFINKTENEGVHM